MSTTKLNARQVSYWDPTANNGVGGEAIVDVISGDSMDDVVYKILNKIKELEDKIKQLEANAVDDMILKE